MTSRHVTDRAGYARLAQQLARQALGIARDAAPHRARAGETRWPMAEALPAARVLLGEQGMAGRDALHAAAESFVDAMADPACRVTDGFGHARPVYTLVAMHLLGTALRLIGDAQRARQLDAVAARATNNAPGNPAVGERCWSALVRLQVGADARPALGFADTADTPAPLRVIAPGEQPDAWTYQELTGLHALYLRALITADAVLADRAARAADYHLGHTQPDYTTYQPWALACFASRAGTAVFAEQQLHDVATHLSIEGPGGAVVPALLLADAAATLGGRFNQAWTGHAGMEVR